VSKENEEAKSTSSEGEEKRRTPRRVQPTFLGKAKATDGQSGQSPLAKKKISLTMDKAKQDLGEEQSQKKSIEEKKIENTVNEEKADEAIEKMEVKTTVIKDAKEASQGRKNSAGGKHESESVTASPVVLADKAITLKVCFSSMQ